MSDNNFLKAYGKRIEELNYNIQECIMAGSSEGKLDLEELMQMFRGCITEIKGLQQKVDSLSDALRNK